jgi:hypothetical protein
MPYQPQPGRENPESAGERGYEKIEDIQQGEMHESGIV